jgi:hypothetical protein
MAYSKEVKQFMIALSKEISAEKAIVFVTKAKQEDIFERARSLGVAINIMDIKDLQIAKLSAKTVREWKKEEKKAKSVPPVNGECYETIEIEPKSISEFNTTIFDPKNDDYDKVNKDFQYKIILPETEISTIWGYEMWNRQLKMCSHTFERKIYLGLIIVHLIIDFIASLWCILIHDPSLLKRDMTQRCGRGSRVY